MRRILQQLFFTIEFILNKITKNLHSTRRHLMLTFNHRAEIFLKSFYCCFETHLLYLNTRLTYCRCKMNLYKNETYCICLHRVCKCLQEKDKNSIQKLWLLPCLPSYTKARNEANIMFAQHICSFKISQRKLFLKTARNYFPFLHCFFL